MTRLAVISFGALVLALAAVAGLDAFTAPHLSQGRPGGSHDHSTPERRASCETHGLDTAEVRPQLLVYQRGRLSPDLGAIGSAS